MTGQLSPLAQGKAAGEAGYTTLLLKTGQTTQYDSELDDGYYEKGVAKSYTVNTAGSQSGTTNVNLAHYAGGAGAIAFNNTTHKITDSGNGLALFKTNDVILTDSASNPGPFTVTTGNNAAEIVCTGATFVNETPAGAVTISKREAISNNTVLDNNTGLVWLRYCCAKFGVSSNGNLDWKGNLYDAFAYCAAANAASLGGYTDWRVPNVNEFMSILDFEATTNLPDSTAFPSFPSEVWTSTTRVNGTTSAYQFYQPITVAAKAGDPKRVILVRGG